MADAPAIQTLALSKTYPGGVRALSGLDLRVEHGEVFGFLGPNGAGKSTTIRLLLDMIRPTEGQALVLGLDSRRDGVAARRRIGYLPGDLRLYDRLTGDEQLASLARLRGSVDPGLRDSLVERFGVVLDRPIRELSKGNRQKLGLVQAFMHRPELLVLDEPTGGLDPLVAARVPTARAGDRGDRQHRLPLLALPRRGATDRGSRRDHPRRPARRRRRGRLPARAGLAPRDGHLRGACRSRAVRSAAGRPRPARRRHRPPARGTRAGDGRCRQAGRPSTASSTSSRSRPTSRRSSSTSTERPTMARELFRRGLLDRSRALIAWCVGVALYILFLAAAFPSLRDAADLNQLVEKYPEGLKELFGLSAGIDLTSGAGFFDAELFSFMLPLFALVLAIGSGTRLLAGEEEAGRLELLFAYPLRRRDGVLAKGATVAVELALFSAAVAAAMLLFDPIFDLGLSVSRVAGAAASLGVLGAPLRLARACRRRLHPEQGSRNRRSGRARGGWVPDCGPARPRGLARPAPLRLGLLVGRPGSAARGRLCLRHARRRRRGGRGARRRRVPDRATRPEDAVARPDHPPPTRRRWQRVRTAPADACRLHFGTASVLRPSVHDNDRAARACQRLPRPRLLLPAPPATPAPSEGS